MIIQSSSLDFAAAHRQQKSYEKKESLEFWIGQRPGASGEANRNDTVRLTDRTRIRQLDIQAVEKRATSSAIATDEDVVKKGTGDQELDIIVYLLEATFGIDIKITDFERLDKRIDRIEEQGEQQKQAMEEAGRQEEPNWGLIYQKEERYEESEWSRVEIDGRVQTKDGRQIDVSLLLDMKRKYVQESSIDFRAGNAQPKDPLVISWNGRAADLQDARFEFDLDADGVFDAMPYLKEGRGYLFLDRNSNNRVDDGSELFGPRTGNGYNELSIYDDDGNGWIDEADRVFKRLGLWAPTEENRQRSYSLEEANVGAISLDHVDTPFMIKNNQNESLGAVKSTGLFLHEQGTAGVVQQLDLFV